MNILYDKLKKILLFCDNFIFSANSYKDSYRMTANNYKDVIQKGTLFVPVQYDHILQQSSKRDKNRTFKYILCYMVILFMSSQNVLYAQQPLNRYLEIAAKNNPELKSKYTDYLAALEVVPQVGALPDPQISFAYFIQPVETRLGPQQAKLSLNQMFPWFGSLGAKEDVQADKAKAKFEEFNETKSKLFFEIKSKYFEMYFIKKSINITLKNIEILKSLKNLVQIKNETGSASAVDEIYAEMEFAELQNELYLLEDNLASANVHFIKLLNSNKPTEITLPDTLQNEDLAVNKQEIIESIRSNNHNLKNMDFLISSFENEKSVAKKSGLPNISLGIDYIFTKENNAISGLKDNGKDAIIFPMIGLNIPLFSPKYSSKVRQSELNQLSAENKKSAKINELESVFETVYKDYNDSKRKQKLYKSQLGLSENALEILESEYSTGEKDFQDLLRMEQKILRYSLQLEKARKDENTSVALINYLMGN